MRSPMIEEANYISESDKKNYSDLKVLCSGAGYYIGTMYNEVGELPEPGSRDSVEYYPSRDEAQKALDENTFTQRLYP